MSVVGEKRVSLRYGANAASKFAIGALAMAMCAGLSDRGVRLVVVRPGPVATPCQANAEGATGPAGYAAPDPKAQPPDEVAAMSLRAVDRCAAVVETSAFLRAASAAARFAPWGLRAAPVRMASREP
jgi:NAD(P)-dependent dehydrogenase (short-subunit alcohol dehydrogenase family)